MTSGPIIAETYETKINADTRVLANDLKSYHQTLIKKQELSRNFAAFIVAQEPFTP